VSSGSAINRFIVIIDIESQNVMTLSPRIMAFMALLLQVKKYIIVHGITD
jgi:hypothetical protein